METLGVDVKVNYRQLQEATKNAAALKQSLKDVGNTSPKINITEPKAGISDAEFGQRSSPASEIAKQNRILHQGLREIVNEGRSTWRERYRIVPPSERGGGGGGGGDNESGAGSGSGPGLLNRSLRTAGRLAGYVAAIGGGASLLTFIHGSAAQAASYGAGEADLIMRGGNGRFRRNAAHMGYTPEEALAIQNEIGGRTGYMGDELDNASLAAARWGRRMGISGERVADYIGGSYATTGASTEEYAKQLKYLRDTAVALGARGRIEEVLRNNQQIMATIVQGRGGKELSDEERTGTLALQMALWSNPGQIGKGQSGVNLLAGLDQGIRAGGGSPGAKMFLAQALGVENLNSMQDVWKFRKRQHEGASVRNVRDILDYSKRISAQLGHSPEEAKTFAMMNISESLGLNENQTEELFTENFQKKLYQADTKPEAMLQDVQKSPEGKKRLKAADIDPASLKGNKHRQTVAQFANTKVDVGEKVLPWFDKYKDEINRLVDEFNKGNYTTGIMEGLKDNPIGQLMLASMGLNLASKVPSIVPLPGGKGISAKTAAATLFGPRPTGIAAGITTIAPHNDQVGEDAVVKKMNQGASLEEIKAEAKKQAEANHGNGSLIDAIWELVTELRIWLHQANGDPIPRYQKH